jgi:mono/diheme cytochrome c family protein
MRKAIKWTGIVLASIVILLLIGYWIITTSIDVKLNKRYSVQVDPIPLETDSAGLAYGKRLFFTEGCVNCHGDRGEGRMFVADPKIGILAGHNLTHGKGGLPADFNEIDWLLALRHGLTRDGKPLIFMPANVYSLLADHEIACIIAYCQTLPPVNNTAPPPTIGWLGRTLTYFNKITMIPADVTDHHYIAPKTVKKEVTAAYGKYISVTCAACHRPDFKGGDNHEPGKPRVADISSTGHLGNWAPEQFIQVFRKGVTPEGKHLDNENMPWQLFNYYTEDELRALYLFLKTQ